MPKVKYIVPGVLKCIVNIYLFIDIKYYTSQYIHTNAHIVQPQIRKSWDSMENANKKRK